ncbi:MAG: SIR2 family protein [Polyangiaceae bacterium]
MTATATSPQTDAKLTTSIDRAAWVGAVCDGLRAGRLAPYFGPGVAHLAGSSAPTTPAELAAFFAAKVALPRRARGDLGAAAQFIESSRHRSIVVNLMSEAFAPPVEPLPIHQAIARLPVPLIVDTWYDGAMRTALANRSDWGEIQGIRRSGLGGDQYFAAYDASGAPCPIEMANHWKTVLYKPHGASAPAKNFLVSDSDYVEVLTEIDIQTPIPDVVKSRRASLGFVFLGCRLNDQTLRAYARQLLKRSGERHFIVVEPGLLTKNEQRFIHEHRLTALVSPLGDVLDRLAQPEP